MNFYVRCSCSLYNNYKNKKCASCGKILPQNRFYIRITDSGKRRYENAGNTLAKAKNFYDIRKIEVKSGGGRFHNPITLEEFVDEYFIPHYASKNKSVKTELSKFNIITNYFNGALLSEIKPLDIERFYQWQLKINAPSTAKNRLAIIRRMFNYAVEIDYLENSPVKTKPIAFDNARKRVLTLEEKQKLLEACKTSKTKELYGLVFIALNTGMRKGEILSLDYKKDIIDECIIIRSENSKSKKDRTIPINNALKEFFGKAGDIEFSCKDYKDSFNNACRKAGITDFRFHDLRHTFASDLVNNGVDLYTVQILLGHSTPVMTQRYAHKDRSQLIKAVNKINQ